MGSFSDDARFMRLALTEAKKSDPFPNPNVGVVLVKDGKVLATGHHEYAGGPHAEINALANVRKCGHAEKIRGSTLYVTLEPCSHTGKKTPPCAPAIIKAGLACVVIGAKDPNPSVSGMTLLRDAGIDARAGVLGRECSIINSRIISSLKRHMPLVAVRYAMSLDGKIATKTNDSKWITGSVARAYSRKLRGSYDVLLVGSNTVMLDNPLLTCRTKGMPEPLRVICDSRLRIRPGMNVFSVLKDRVLVVTSKARDKTREQELKAAGISVLICGKTRVDLRQLLRRLFSMGKHSVLVEGGGELIGSAFDMGAVDRVYAFIAPKIIGGDGAVSPVRGKGAALVRNALKLSNAQILKLGGDFLVIADAERR
ncbi:MAG: bifunctional diaminohydroxyphosphoribosylaminopyrimidine deaminase/5-amino-6-(5-phosphoribosylamino)uracil reductase RibD [Candidatus Burarchaeum sp.]|nr:bifunctional diaminohydroxyphosphoribosylaminopyrimidine deaminase/5-amino-6-(5-phosphoribosylamino)uracil reductase RibD [Candidatus Burarchaeum sp.]MDO8340108.1 bifunctional diaminohydroxyphosphoribosylaminopyrimidine deaminase/5-amino-6-(5-phosphoribosylamino)uracil reductase RibD [Candidatus Burarchaeum sp.]